MADHYIAFWNVENLFDIENSPRRGDKLARALKGELKGWTQQRLDRKVLQLGKIIRQMNGGNGPDLLGVCEIENRHVLELLSAEMGKDGRQYEIAHDDMSDRRGIDVAFIFDPQKFTAEMNFSHTIIRRKATRELFQVNFRTAAGNPLIIVGNHWPSRIGGTYETEPHRIIAGETLAYFHERIREEQPLKDDIGVLAMGDFNDEPFSRSVVEHALSEHQRRKVTLARTPRFLNLMWSIVGQRIGTHYYDNVAAVLDQFLVSKGLLTGNSGLTVDVNSVEVLRYPEMMEDRGYPKPVRFDRGKNTNINGYSDHFPIAMMLRD